MQGYVIDQLAALHITTHRSYLNSGEFKVTLAALLSSPAERQFMQRIVILNPKGGSGKTTLATNLAAYFACHGIKTALIDYDSQGSSTDWLGRRPDNYARIQCISAFRQSEGVTRSFAMRTDPGTEVSITDTPGALELMKFSSVFDQADAILIPVLPSEIDIRAATDCVSRLLAKVKVREPERIAVLANRSRTNTRVYQKLAAALDSMSITFIATLRDSQNYISSAEEGIGLFEMQGSGVRRDIETWQPVIEWLCRQGCEVQRNEISQPPHPGGVQFKEHV
jgi:chromosome partitioning protein